LSILTRLVEHIMSSIISFYIPPLDLHNV